MPLDEWWRDYATHAFVKYARSLDTDNRGLQQDIEAVNRVFEIMNRERSARKREKLKNTTEISKRRVFDRLLGSCALLSVEQPNGKIPRIERCIELTKEMA